MRVLYILAQDSGGLPHYAAQLANAVAEHADVVVLKPTSTTADDAFSDKVRVESVFEPMGISTRAIYNLDIDIRQLLRSISSYRQMRSIRDIDPDIIHNTARMFPQVQIFLRRYGLTKQYPYVETWHEAPQLSLSDPLFSGIEIINREISAPGKSKLIVHTKSHKERVKRQSFHPNQIEVIPHGTFDLFRKYDQGDVSMLDNHLLFFGHIIPQKGLDTVVRSIPIIRTQIPDITLTIAGAGDISRKSQAIIQRYPENFDVYNTFIPNEKVGEFFRRTEIVVLPYTDEWANGHSGALTIAYSFGKPIIATAVGEFPELVEEPGCGVIVPPSNPERLAKAIVRLLNDEDTRSTMGERSKEMGEALSWENIAKKHMNVYQSIVT